MQVCRQVLHLSVHQEVHLQIPDKDLPDIYRLLGFRMFPLVLCMYMQHLLQKHQPQECRCRILVLYL